MSQTQDNLSQEPRSPLMRRIGWTSVIVLSLAIVLLATAMIYRRDHVDPKRMNAAVPEVELDQRLQAQP